MSLASALRAHAMFATEPLKRKKPRRPKWPHKQRADYYRELLAMLKRIEAVVQRELIPQLPRIVAMVNITRPEDAPIRNDAPGDEIDGVVATVIAQVDAEVDDAEIEMLAQRNVVRTTVWHGNEFQKQVREVAAINVYDDTTGLLPHLEVAVKENVRLIKGLKAKTLDEIQGVVLRGARAGVHQTVIAEQIQQQFGMSKKRAALIATDQVGKLNGELNQIRQQRLGVRRYRWSSSQDERVRKRHRQLNGTIQEWAKPPVTDERTGERAHPGQPIRCRCQPIPIIDDVFADAGLIDPSEVETGAHSKETTTVGKRGRRVRYKGGKELDLPGRAPIPDYPPVTVPPRPPANAPTKRKAARAEPQLPAPPPLPPKPVEPPSTRLGEVGEKIFGRKLTDSELNALFGMEAKLPPGMRMKFSLVREDAKHGHVRVIGGVFNEKDHVVANISRAFRREEGLLTVEHSSFFVDEAHQSAGIGRAVFNAQIDAYERLGVESVKLEAASVGRYVWTKAGFDWSPEHAAELMAELNTRLTRKLGAKAAGRVMAKVATPQDVASLVVDGERVGKDLLLDFLLEGSDLIPMSQTPAKIKRL